MPTPPKPFDRTLRKILIGVGVVVYLGVGVVFYQTHVCLWRGAVHRSERTLLKPCVMQTAFWPLYRYGGSFPSLLSSQP